MDENKKILNFFKRKWVVTFVLVLCVLIGIRLFYLLLKPVDSKEVKDVKIKVMEKGVKEEKVVEDKKEEVIEVKKEEVIEDKKETKEQVVEVKKEEVVEVERGTKEKVIEVKKETKEEVKKVENAVDVEKKNDVFEEVVKPKIEGLNVRNDFLWENQLKSAMTGVSNGTMDIKEAYDLLIISEKELDAIAKEYNEIGEFEDLSKEHNNSLKKFRENMSNAAMNRKYAVVELKSMIEENDYTPIRLVGVKKWVDKADLFLAEAKKDYKVLQDE